MVGWREEKGAALLHATNPPLLCWTLGAAGELIFPPFNATAVIVSVSYEWMANRS